ncbi:MAG: hypothetical protein HWD58_18050 [Bacteroidota bacterium]|nr:MAG: hypothetical protein HWD58_18050 [Bacteroidota bacterium]
MPESGIFPDIERNGNGGVLCESTKDPNDVKPMARMMRTMADYCDTMRLELQNGKTVDSVRFPLMPFWTAEPTDSSVLETLFFNNAKTFAASWRTLMSSEKIRKPIMNW